MRQARYAKISVMGQLLGNKKILFLDMVYGSVFAKFLVSIVFVWSWDETQKDKQTLPTQKHKGICFISTKYLITQSKRYAENPCDAAVFRG